MAAMPGAKQRPLATKMTQPRMLSHAVVCVHTMVGSLAGTEAMFKRNGYTGTESHFGTGGDGEIRQWVDTAFSADANYRGSRDVISIENADHGPEFKKWNISGDNVPAFTPAQIEANAQIIAWVHKTHGTPLVLIPNTRPSSRGVGYHAQGVPGNGLVSGGVQWSKARGKVCPGRRRIAQIPQIIRRAQEIAGGAPIVVIEEDSMKHITSGRHSKPQTIKPGEKRRIRTDADGNYTMGATKKGQLLQTTAFIGINGLLQGEKAIVRRVIVDYNAKLKRSTIRHRSDFAEVVGTGNGDYVREQLVFTDGSCGYGVRGDERPRFHLEIENRGASDIIVNDVAFTTIGS